MVCKNEMIFVANYVYPCKLNLQDVMFTRMLKNLLLLLLSIMNANIVFREETL